YWEGKAEEAVELASRARALVSPRPYKSADAFRWDSGFESLEGMAVGFASDRSYLADQIIAFGAFASGLAETGKDAARAAECAARLSTQAREEKLATVHPSVHLYLFYRYLVLERLSPGSMDASTALSKAFKALQLRAARMTAAAEKDGFMAGNRWNRALLAEARRRKLI
ncbi:MAG: hypothetical protein Q8M76_00585, partial [Spirochaetaceae bacterium]|nr:hypothetical protein [Spirochaetaceae bacterium]